MYEIEQLSFSWGCPIAFQCSVHRIIFTSSLLNWSSSSDDFGLFSFNICFFQFQKTRQFGVMLPLYFPGYILQKAILGRNLHNIFPKNQRFGPSQNAGFVNDSAFKKQGSVWDLQSPVTWDLMIQREFSRQFSWRKSPTKGHAIRPSRYINGTTALCIATVNVSFGSNQQPQRGKGTKSSHWEEKRPKIGGFKRIFVFVAQKRKCQICNNDFFLW